MMFSLFDLNIWEMVYSKSMVNGLSLDIISISIRYLEIFSCFLKEIRNILGKK